MRLLSVVAAILLAAAPAFGLGLTEMQEKALNNREVIKRYMINLQKSAEDQKLARAGFLPSVDLSYQANKTDEGSGVSGLSTAQDVGTTVGTTGGVSFSPTEYSIFYAAVTYNLFNGFKDKYQLESAQLLSQVEEYQLDGLKQDIQLNVALRYLDVYERNANLTVSGKNYETLQKLYRDAQNRLDVGLIDRNELLKIKVDLDDAGIQVDAARAGLEKSVQLLSREIGSEVRFEDLSFAEFADIPGAQDREANQALMLANRSELKVLDRLIEATRQQIKVEQSGFYPKVNIVGSFSNYDDDYLNGSGDINQDELRASLELTMNLYRGGSTEASVAKQELEVRGLRYDLDEQRATFTTDLANLHTDFKVSLRNVDVALLGIEQAEENLRITRLKYDEGLQRESDLLDAVANLSRARYNYVAVVRTVFLNYFRIQRMTEAF